MMRKFVPHPHVWGKWKFLRQNAPMNIYRRTCRVCGAHDDKESRIVA